jgi:hypothetical protein
MKHSAEKRKDLKSGSVHWYALGLMFSSLGDTEKATPPE